MVNGRLRWIAPSGYQAHHIIPRKFIKELLSRYGKRMGWKSEKDVDKWLDRAENVIWWENKSHGKNASRLNDKIEEWLEDNPNATLDQVRRYAERATRELAQD